MKCNLSQKSKKTIRKKQQEDQPVGAGEMDGVPVMVEILGAVE